MFLRNTIIFAFIVMQLAGLSACKSESSTEPLPVPVPADTTFTDVEGNTYKAQKIGGRYWMTENFKSTKSANGVTLQEVYTYENTNSNAAVYGRLYTWPAAVKAAPTGWRLPTKEEWDTFINSLGGAGEAGGKLKESGTAHWNSPNSGATNSSGFMALPAGWRGGDGLYYDLGKHCDFWGTANSGQDPFCLYLYNTSANIISEVSPIDKTSGIAFSVRYVKN